MDLQEIRNLVRTHLDLEVEDLPDQLLDAFVREGSRRIEQAERYWPFYQEIYPFTVVASTASSTLAEISAELIDVSSISLDDGRLLKYVGPHEFDRLRVAEQSGNLWCFTQWGETLFWGPVAGSATNLTIRGYRRAIDWVADGAGASPDLPPEFHNTVFLWALAKAYFQQEDPELGSQYERMFADELNLYRRRFTQANTTQPIVLGGNTHTHSLRPPAVQLPIG